MKTNDELSSKQRVAYVLHDLFAVPFDQVAAALATSPGSAKKLASRARAKPRNTQTRRTWPPRRSDRDHRGIPRSRARRGALAAVRARRAHLTEGVLPAAPPRPRPGSLTWAAPTS
ncbi:sigma factor-like helix-turn-helix DNA-binding protein [Micromonospora sp. NPDC002717]|uniref:sigma factor-like helix-turn-helix DNA-binding protein n=1 Tax=Micromonospora sp. NPDC002717 TaxID=3154424 RepID=UPI00332F0DFF